MEYHIITKKMTYRDVGMFLKSGWALMISDMDLPSHKKFCFVGALELCVFWSQNMWTFFKPGKLMMDETIRSLFSWDADETVGIKMQVPFSFQEDVSHPGDLIKAKIDRQLLSKLSSITSSHTLGHHCNKRQDPLHRWGRYGGTQSTVWEYTVVSFLRFVFD